MIARIYEILMDVVRSLTFQYNKEPKSQYIKDLKGVRHHSTDAYLRHPKSDLVIDSAKKKYVHLIDRDT